MVRKKNFKIFAECIKEKSNISCRLGDKTLLTTVHCEGLIYICKKALSEIYTPENWKLIVK